AEVLASQGADITPAHIKDGLFSVKWEGRLQVLRRDPWVVVDGAHNADSMQKLGHALKAHFSYDRLTLVLGFGNDKDLAGMMDEAVRFTDNVVIVASKHPRSVPAAELAAGFAKRGIVPVVADTVPAAMKIALKNATPEDLICAAGSVFVIAEVLEEMG
ncbi:MAG: hypothetical protein MUO19_05695, partial [Dehalococcoidales bacterium]|nr:hypothetical protein [Dehalococcoidales bacterium]